MTSVCNEILLTQNNSSAFHLVNISHYLSLMLHLFDKHHNLGVTFDSELFFDTQVERKSHPALQNCDSQPASGHSFALHNSANADFVRGLFKKATDQMPREKPVIKPLHPL